MLRNNAPSSTSGKSGALPNLNSELGLHSSLFEEVLKVHPPIPPTCTPPVSTARKEWAQKPCDKGATNGMEKEKSHSRSISCRFIGTHMPQV